jgi:hypothetical protein
MEYSRYFSQYFHFFGFLFHAPNAKGFCHDLSRSSFLFACDRLDYPVIKVSQQFHEEEQSFHHRDTESTEKYKRVNDNELDKGHRNLALYAKEIRGKPVGRFPR